MSRSVVPLKFCALVVVLLLHASAFDAAGVRYRQLTRDLIESRLRKYAGNDKEREATLKQMFSESGCDVQHILEQPVKGSKLPNLICVLPGNTERVIIVGAHFDHVSAGDGVVDNWSGASLLPSLYESIKTVPRNHTYIFIGFTDEEKGEIGSHFYARNMTETQVVATDAMVNMDTLGLAHTEIWATHSDKHLGAELAYVAKRMNFPLAAVNVEQVGSTDSEQFALRKIPSVTIHSLTQEAWNARILHTSKDKISAMKLDDYYQTYCLVTAYLAFLDQAANSRGTQTNH